MLGLFCSLALTQVSGQAATEHDVKAAFLYKFASYVEWPDGVFSDEGSPVVFGIMDAREIESRLQQLVRGRQVQGRAVQVRRLRAGDEVSGVHILFIGRDTAAEVDAILLDASARSVLTVTETEPRRFAGSIINFEIVDGKVRFDVSMKPAEQGGLRISSRLLQVASSVIEG
jgi:hypothetical protein